MSIEGLMEVENLHNIFDFLLLLEKSISFFSKAQRKRVKQLITFLKIDFIHFTDKCIEAVWDQNHQFFTVNDLGLEIMSFCMSSDSEVTHSPLLH